MAENLVKGEVPAQLAQDLAGRDTTPLAAGMLVKYQYIALIPTRATNFRFVVYKDGRLYYAANSAEENDPVFNTPLPDEPNRILPADVIAAIEAQLEAVGFFKQPSYVAIPSRGGAVSIVTARQDSRVHEVWYANVNNDLTDLLYSITPDEPVETTPEEDLAYWQDVLSDMKQQAAAQQGDSDSPADDADPADESSSG